MRVKWVAMAGALGSACLLWRLQETRRVLVVHDLGSRPVSLTVARGCVHGSVVSWAPRSAARLIQTARARDGLVIALTLKPTGTRSSFRVTVKRDGKVTARVIVRLPKELA
jgi:hypothetical protein